MLIRDVVDEQDYKSIIRTDISGVKNIPPWELGFDDRLSRDDRRIFDNGTIWRISSPRATNCFYRLISESRIDKYDMKRVLYEHLILMCAKDVHRRDTYDIRTCITFKNKELYEPIEYFIDPEADEYKCGDYYSKPGLEISTRIKDNYTLLEEEITTQELDNKLISLNPSTDLDSITNEFIDSTYAKYKSKLRDENIRELEYTFSVTFYRRDYEDELKDCIDNVFDCIAWTFNHNGKLDKFTQKFIFKYTDINIAPHIDYAGVFSWKDLSGYIHPSMVLQWYSDMPEYRKIIEQNELSKLDLYRKHPLFYCDYLYENWVMIFPNKSVLYMLKYSSAEYTEEKVSNTQQDAIESTVKALSFGDTGSSDVTDNNYVLKRSYLTIPHGLDKYISDTIGCFPILSKLGVIDYNFICTSNVLKNTDRLHELLLLTLNSFVDTVYDRWLVSSGDNSYIPKDRFPTGIIIIQDINNINNLKTTQHDSYLLDCVKISLSYNIEDENGNPVEYSDFYQTIYNDMSNNSPNAIDILYTLQSWDELVSKANDISDNIDYDKQHNIASLDLIIDLNRPELQIVKYAYNALGSNPIFSVPMSKLIVPLCSALSSNTGLTVHPNEYFDVNTSTERLHVKFYLLPSVIELSKSSPLLGSIEIPTQVSTEIPTETSIETSTETDIEPVVVLGDSKTGLKIYPRSDSDIVEPLVISNTDSIGKICHFKGKLDLHNNELNKNSKYRFISASKADKIDTEDNAVPFYCYIGKDDEINDNCCIPVDKVYFNSNIYTGFHNFSQEGLYEELYNMIIINTDKLYKYWSGTYTKPTYYKAPVSSYHPAYGESGFEAFNLIDKYCHTDHSTLMYAGDYLGTRMASYDKYVKKNIGRISEYSEEDIDECNVPGLTFNLHYFIERHSIIILDLPDKIDEKYMIRTGEGRADIGYFVPGYIIYLEHLLDDNMMYSGGLLPDMTNVNEIDNYTVLNNILDKNFLDNNISNYEDKFMNNKLCTKFTISINKEDINKYIKGTDLSSMNDKLSILETMQYAANNGCFSSDGVDKKEQWLQEGKIHPTETVDNIPVTITVERCRITFDDPQVLNKLVHYS